MSNQSPTRRGRSVLFDDCQPTHPPVGSENWPAATLAGTAKSVLFDECEPAAAERDELPWLWSELPDLREWVRQRIVERNGAGRSIDVVAVLRDVVNAVVAQRPHLGTASPREYLHTLAERIVSQAV